MKSLISKLIILILLFDGGLSAFAQISSTPTVDQEKLICIDKTKSYKDKHLFLQDVAQKVEYVKLETTNDCLIGKELKIQSIRVTNTDIFIVEWDNIYRFRKDGKFLNKIGQRGEGPKEYVTMESIAINEKEQEFLAYDITKKKILYYKYNGEFVREIDFPQVSEIALLDNNALACYSVSSAKYSKTPSFGLYSLVDGRLIKKISDPYKSRSGTAYNLVSKYRAPRKNRGHVYFNTFISDTIFSINSKGKTARYALLPPNNGRTTKDCESCSTPFLLCETDTYANLQVYGKDVKKFTSYIVDKKTGTITNGFVVDKEYSGAIFPFNTGINNTVVSMYYTYNLYDKLERGVLSGKLKEVTKTLEEDANPVLMIATF